MDNKLETQIADVEEQLRQAMLASDVSALDKLLATNLIFTNHLGQRMSKEDDLSAHASGALNISQLESKERIIKIIDKNVAVVSVRMQVEGVYAGQPAGGNFMFTRVWAIDSIGKWKIVAAHAGLITE
jgi:ketosteroid isomerase-like protein